MIVPGPGMRPRKKPRNEPRRIGFHDAHQSSQVIQSDLQFDAHRPADGRLLQTDQNLGDGEQAHGDDDEIDAFAGADFRRR